MIKHLELCILVDNNNNSDDLMSEHGFSLWIKADEHRILFDTGQSDILYENALRLGIDLFTADGLVISHGHYDHTGGISKVLELNRAIKIFCHPGIFVPRYSRQSDCTMKTVGISAKVSYELHQTIAKIKWVNGPVYISDDIGITGPIPRISTFEDTGGSFFLDPEGKRPDPINDDLAIWFRTANGIVVVTGCCHSGLVNTLEYVKRITGHVKIHTVIGGLHLVHASMDRLEKTCDYLHVINFSKLIPCHCTGEKSVEYLKEQFRNRVQPGAVGSSLIF